MGKKIDLRSPKVREHKRQVATYGTQTPLSSTAVERGSTRWLNGSTVVIEGLLDVTGTATVGGTLSVTGTFNGSGVNNLDGTNNLSGDNNLTGPTEISGSLDVTGPTTLDGVLTINGDTSITGLLTITGDTTITGLLSIEGDSTISGKLDVTGAMSTKGTLSVEGVTTLKNDLNIDSGGKITAGNVVVDPTGGGRIYFADGQIRDDGALGMFINSPNGVRTNTSGITQINSGSNVNVISGGSVNITAADTKINGNLEVTGNAKAGSLNIGAGTEILNNRLKIGSLPNTSIATANVHVDSNGYFYRVV